MQAVILAAGAGTRMKSLIDIPKGLIKIGKLEIIRRTINLLNKYGVDSFIIVVNGKSQSFYEDFLKKTGIKAKLILNPHPEKGNGYSLYISLKHCKTEEFILTMSDHIYEEEFIKKAIKCKGVVFDRMGKYTDPQEATKVKVKSGKVIEAGKNLKKFDGFDTGFFVIDKTKIIKAFEKLSREEHLELSKVISLADLPGCEVSGYFWMDIDTPKDIDRARKLLVYAYSQKSYGDGQISKYINRKISRYMSYRLIEKVSPAQITIVSFIVGIASGIVTLINAPIGGLLYQLSSIIDGVDGEIARASMSESKFGGWIDSILDRITDFVFLICAGATLGSEHWALIATTIFGVTMVSYSTERFTSAYCKNAYREIAAIILIPGKRDERIFFVSIMCIIGKILAAFYILTAVTFARLALTAILVWRYENQIRR